MNPEKLPDGFAFASKYKRHGNGIAIFPYKYKNSDMDHIPSYERLYIASHLSTVDEHGWMIARNDSTGKAGFILHSCLKEEAKKVLLCFANSIEALQRIKLSHDLRIAITIFNNCLAYCGINIMNFMNNNEWKFVELALVTTV